MIPRRVNPAVRSSDARKQKTEIDIIPCSNRTFNRLQHHAVFEERPILYRLCNLQRYLRCQSQIPDLLVPSLRIPLNRRIHVFISDPNT